MDVANTSGPSNFEQTLNNASSQEIRGSLGSFETNSTTNSEGTLFFVKTTICRVVSILSCNLRNFLNTICFLINVKYILIRTILHSSKFLNFIILRVSCTTLKYSECIFLSFVIFFSCVF